MKRQGFYSLCSSEHDEEGACLQFMIDPLTFIWVYTISEHKINFSGEVGQTAGSCLLQRVPVGRCNTTETSSTSCYVPPH